MEDESPEIDWLDLLFPFRSPGSRVSDNDFLSLLFPPPSETDVNRVVYSSGWYDRLTAGTSLGDPHRLASVLSQGLAAGKTQAEIARDLLPEVDGVRSSARRVARTEGIRVLGKMQEEAAKSGLGSLIIGWQIHSTANPHSRSWHQHRSGTIYYLNPGPGQKGLRQCPHPPEEAADPNERPIINGKRAPFIAQNCLCMLLPVVSDPGADTRAALDAQGPAPVVAHEVYSDFFRTVDARQRRIAVGARRYSVVRDALGREPDWEHFVDPHSGALVDVATLRTEDRAAREKRTAHVRGQVAGRRLALRRTRDYGALRGV